MGTKRILDQYFFRQKSIFFDPNTHNIELQLLDFIANLDEVDYTDDDEEKSFRFKNKFIIK